MLRQHSVAVAAFSIQSRTTTGNERFTMEKSQSSAAPSAPSSTSLEQTQKDNNNPPISSSYRYDDVPFISKRQLRKRRRLENMQAIKKRRREQVRELKRLNAKSAGRDLDTEREQQLKNEKEGTRRKRRDERWKVITQNTADIDNSFRVCFDCSFEDRMTPKEIYSLGLQLRCVYAANRKSTMPVNVDVCGLKRGGQARENLEKVQGFPERWAVRSFRCYEESMEEIYGRCIENNSDGTDEISISSVKCEDNESKGKDRASIIAEDSYATVNDPPALPFPKLQPNHKFVYLTGDSPNTLTTLDNNTTYIIGGLVDRNRLKRAAIRRALSIASSQRRPSSLNIQTARLPLDEHLDFKGSTRILACNHVFEILQR